MMTTTARMTSEPSFNLIREICGCLDILESVPWQRTIAGASGQNLGSKLEKSAALPSIPSRNA